MTPYVPTRWLVTNPIGGGDPDVFPTLAGQSFLVSKKPSWSTAIATAASGRERRRSAWSYPLWSFKLSYEVVQDQPAASELQLLLAFFNAHAGRFRQFFFRDPSDDTAVAQPFGTGDGTTTTFQLTRTIMAGGVAFTEPVTGVLSAPTVLVGTTPVAAFTLGPYGRITFASPPPAGAVLTWTGSFMFCCRFDQDELDCQQMMARLWSQGGLSFVTVKR